MSMPHVQHSGAIVSIEGGFNPAITEVVAADAFEARRKTVGKCFKKGTWLPPKTDQPDSGTIFPVPTNPGQE